ncbi:MAG: UbiX family flavin prenyltransferase [Crenarchaeota archaeon]|nr:UbiX family flavin prenyltransferase [Thermoproteota archaeon]
MYIVCITGASGAIYGIRLIEELKKRTGSPITLIMSRWGLQVIINEVDPQYRRKIMKLIDQYYIDTELDAEIASGGSKFRAVIIAPCSMKTLSDIAHGRASNLITRVTDVALKENRKVIIVPRETPIDYIHIRNMLLAKKRGITIIQPSPAFYNKPQTIEDIVNHIIGKILDHLEIEHNLYRPWRMMRGHGTDKNEEY